MTRWQIGKKKKIKEKNNEAPERVLTQTNKKSIYTNKLTMPYLLSQIPIYNVHGDLAE